MRHIRKVLATVAAAALMIGVAAGPASAAKGGNGIKSPEAAKRNCEKRGGTFVDLQQLGTVCLFPSS